MATTQFPDTINLRIKTEEDISWLREHLISEWGGEPLVADKRTHYPTQLPGCLAVLDGPEGEEIVGEATYLMEQPDCEVVTLSSLREGQGIGTALFHFVETAARTAGCKRLRLVTTTDNLGAIGFYQKHGMRIVEVLIDALDEVRRLKPQIGHIGMHDIPLQDALLLEKNLE